MEWAKVLQIHSLFGPLKWIVDIAGLHKVVYLLAEEIISVYESICFGPIIGIKIDP